MSTEMRRDIKTYTGHYFNFEHIEQNTVTVNDVAKGLSNVCRFAGQCEEHYSVAQHSVLVSQIVAKLGGNWKAIFGGLMHDVSEAFLGDITSPLKREIGALYKPLEERTQRWLEQRLAPTADHLSPLIHHADMIALRIEQRDVMTNDDDWYALRDHKDHPLVVEFKIGVMQPKQAYEMFCERYTECLYNVGVDAPQPFLAFGE